MSLLRIEKDGLFLDGKPFYLACGDIQYFRIHPSQWRQRLKLMKNFGLTAVQTYVPWNLHEPKEGLYDFSGILDLREFLSVAAQEGLYVLLRPSPYICGEWDFGAMPWWLLGNPRAALRCMDETFMAAVSRYYKRLCTEFVPFLSTRGGPILLVDIENEYGGFGDDIVYLSALKAELEKNGVDVPFYETDNTFEALKRTKLPGVWQGINYRIESAEKIAELRKIQPALPPLVGEYWSGRAIYWGEEFRPRDIPPIAKAYRTALDLGASVSFYMFCGGTNFGFMNGSRITDSFTPSGKRIFRSITTSYDTDALISEDGRATEKYYACRNELDGYLGRPIRTSREPEPELQPIPEFRLTESAPLFDNLDALSEPVYRAEPATMESLGQGYGFLLYTAFLREGFPTPMRIHVEGLHDRALIFADNRYLGVLQRDMPEAEINVASALDPVRLDILVENMGRNNTRPELRDEKGILGEVRWGGARVFGWEHRCLPLNDLSRVRFGAQDDRMPAFYRGIFRARAGVGTHLSLKGWGKGCAFINGFPLGRYWKIGPQETLYVPGAVLKDGDNELILFELHHANENKTVRGFEKAILSGEWRCAAL